MKFLLDQDVYAATGRFLSGLGHDVVRVAELGLSQAADEELLRISEQQARILVTRDRDYGTLVFIRHQACPNVDGSRMRNRLRERWKKCLQEC